MFRKLTSFLFKEEEIILDEQEHTLEEVTIKPLKPRREQVEKPAESVVEKKVEPETKKEPVIQTKEEPVKKSVMIDLELEKREPRVVQSDPSVKTAEYRRRRIISPIYGGPDKGEGETPTELLTQIKPKTKTSVISPMYGSVQKEESEEAQLELDLDLKTMLETEPLDEEVQASLFDFIEETVEDE